MLEVKDLKKIYKSKKGTDVHALDGVSLRFPETGMVFLLGKSGSGKSTLLNVCGGLDNPTEGEVIVKGRSSKTFSGSDFDSYRNTFIGFIFQEYNILNEFTVEDNIALALELQGKPKDKAAIAALLDEVDLTGYAKRKPNTLSGGQKQRIAIARALIKKPEIIMADEPTGALDSNTGKQVFDTLKKLSKSKLVIVVSHDRDFAEQYGDRIIELKDGKVLSDVSKTHAEAEAFSANVNRVGDVLCIKKGADLSEADFEKIKSFLKTSDSDVVIASDEKSVSAFKSAARITDAGEMEVFRDTNVDAVEKKIYSKEDSRFIRSKLPIRHAFKIGVSGIRNKPVRLFFTVLLCSVAFVLFGLLSTMNFYDSEATFKQTLQDTQLSALQVRKQYTAQVSWFTNGEEDHSYENYMTAKFSSVAVKELSERLNPNAFGAVDIYSGFNVRQQENQYWQNNISAMAVLSENNALRSQINGEYPKNANEMVISSYHAELLMECKVYGEKGDTLELNSPTDIIGKTITVDGRSYKITGILDSGAIPDKFQALKNSDAVEDYNLYRSFASHLESGLHLVCFINEEGLAEFSNRYDDYRDEKENYMYIAVGVPQNGEYEMPEYGDFYYLGFSSIPANQKIYAIDQPVTALTDKQVILPIRQFASTVGEQLNRLNEQAYADENYTLAESYSAISQILWEVEAGGIHVENKETGEWVLQPFTDAEMEAKIQSLLASVKFFDMDMTVGVQLFNPYTQSHFGEIGAYTVVGFYRPETESYRSALYFADTVADKLWQEQKFTVSNYPEYETKYVSSPEDIYSVVILPGNPDTSKLDTLWEVYSNEDFDENDSRINLGGGFVDSLKNVDYMIKELSKVFFYVGLVLAVFAALLLSNFISVSISNKKREIGILRAVGARGADVFKIFLSESFVIGAICVALSTVASVFLCRWLNSEFAAELGASIFVFGVMSFGVLVAIAFVTILVATFLPVNNAARKKPVDSIRAL